MPLCGELNKVWSEYLDVISEMTEKCQLDSIINALIGIFLDVASVEEKKKFEIIVD